MGVYLIVRGFWIAIVGLSSVFPEGINTKTLNFSQKFSARIYKIKIESYLIQIDKFCSSLFAFAIILVSLITTFSMMLIILLLVAVSFSKIESTK